MVVNCNLVSNLLLTMTIGASIWITKSPWPLLGFFFFMGWRDNLKFGKCPACKALVTFERKDGKAQKGD